MISAFARNSVCAIALVVGTAMIGTADYAKAEILPCEEEYLAQIEASEQELPVLCDRMVVIGKRVTPANEVLAQDSGDLTGRLAATRDRLIDGLQASVRERLTLSDSAS